MKINKDKVITHTCPKCKGLMKKSLVYSERYVCKEGHASVVGEYNSKGEFEIMKNG